MRTRELKIGLGVLAAAIYAALRLWRLDETCLWFDEIFSIHAAEHDWTGLLRFAALDIVHPPLFYAILKIWIGIVGEGIFWVRLLPVTFSLLALIPLVLLSKQIDGNSETKNTLIRWPLTIAIFLLAVNGALIRYAQELRMYSMLMFLALMSAWLFARYLFHGKSIILLTLVNVILVYTHYFGWFVVLAETASIVYMGRHLWRQFTLSTLICILCFVPWALAVVRAAGESEGLAQNIGWTPRPGVSDVLRLGLSLFEPFYYPATTVAPRSVYAVSVPLLMAVLVLIGSQFAKKRSEARRWDRGSVLLIILSTIPVTAALAMSWTFTHSIWGTRHLSMIFAPVALGVGYLVVPARRELSAAAVTMLIVFSAYAFVGYAKTAEAKHIWCCWGELSSSSTIGPEVYAFEDLVAYHLWFANRNGGTQVKVIKDLPGVTEDPGFFMPRGFTEIQKVTLDDLRAVETWAAFRSSAAGAEQLYKEEPMRSLIERGYRPVEIHDLQADGQRAYLVRLKREQ